MLLALVPFLALCAGGAAFYSYYAVTGRSFRDMRLLRGGGPMGRAYAAVTAFSFVTTGIAAVVIALWVR